jgi:hypothetical protein
MNYNMNLKLPFALSKWSLTHEILARTFKGKKC